MSIFNPQIIEEAKESFQHFYDGTIDWAIVLGSGLSQVGEFFEIIKETGIGEIQHLKTSAVKGHRGCFLIGKSGDKTLLIMQGRVHLYEGHSAFEVTLPVAMMGSLGIRNIILTNAAGGVNTKFRPGDIMAITDHINLQGTTPLQGIGDSSKFLDMSSVYDEATANRIAQEFGIHTGVYVAGLGPQYETPAEVRYIRTIGGDAVGMSTVLEAIMARYYGMRIAGFSLISNMAAGIVAGALSHQEVVETGKMAGKKMMEILRRVVEL